MPAQRRLRLTLRARTAAAARNAALDAPRLLALLPAGRSPDIALDGPDMTVRFPADTEFSAEETAEIRAAVRTALADPALKNWELEP